MLFQKPNIFRSSSSSSRSFVYTSKSRVRYSSVGLCRRVRFKGGGIRKMSSFRIQENGVDVEVKLCGDLKKDELLGFAAFKNWLPSLLHTLSLQTSNKSHPYHKTPYTLKSITTQSFTRFGPRIGFMTINAEITNSEGAYVPGTVFLRGGSVGMLMILTPTDNDKEKWVLMTSQPRIAAGTLSFLEIPAGMVDGSGNFAGAAAREIEEETGLVIDSKDLIDLSALALSSSPSSTSNSGFEEVLPKAMFPSPGACDESITLYLYEKKVSREELNAFRGKMTGLRDEGENITLKLVKLENLWREGARDGKTLAALALYEGLRREGRL